MGDNEKVSTAKFRIEYAKMSATRGEEKNGTGKKGGKNGIQTQIVALPRQLYIESNPMNYYHVFRQDSNGVWSEKFDEPGEGRVATPDGYRPFTDEVDSSGAFYCAWRQSLPDLTAAESQPIDVTAETFSPSPGLTIQLKT